MNAQSEMMNVDIELTEQAFKRVQTLINQKKIQNILDMKLRIYIIGGGCSGFQYGFKLDNEMNEDDMLIVQNGISIVVDALSAQYLIGAKIDYIENLQGARFMVSNPNAETTCGCGSSFSLKE